jgi:hypothetical protein
MGFDIKCLKIILIVLTISSVPFIYYTTISALEPDTICQELTNLMLDDPEHMRLHNDYPNLFIHLHQYIDMNC